MIFSLHLYEIIRRLCTRSNQTKIIIKSIEFTYFQCKQHSWHLQRLLSRSATSMALSYMLERYLAMRGVSVRHTLVVRQNYWSRIMRSSLFTTEYISPWTVVFWYPRLYPRSQRNPLTRQQTRLVWVKTAKTQIFNQ